jgi:hypothetical protein
MYYSKKAVARRRAAACSRALAPQKLPSPFRMYAPSHVSRGAHYLNFAARAFVKLGTAKSRGLESHLQPNDRGKEGALFTFDSSS